jgi:hypothetical protein
MPVFKIYLTNGTRIVHTARAAPDVEFAIKGAEHFFEGSGWRVIR